MNAIPQKLHNYQRIQIPQTPMIERTQPVSRIQSLDERRQAKLNAVKRQELTERSRRMAQGLPDRELDYSMSYKKASVPRNVSPQARQARKVTAAYEVRGNSYGARQRESFAYAGGYAPQRQQGDVRQRGGYGYSYGYGGGNDNGYRMNAGGTVAAPRPKVPGFDMYAEEPETAYVDQTEERPKVSRKGVVSTVLCIALIFVMLAGVLMKYAELSNITYQNSQSEKRIAQLERDIDKINMDIALGEDLTSIQQRATELGMAYPVDNQVVYLPPDTEPADTVTPFTEEGMVTVTGDVNGVASTDITAQSDTGVVSASNGSGYFDNAVQKFKDFWTSIGDALGGVMG